MHDWFGRPNLLMTYEFLWMLKVWGADKAIPTHRDGAQLPSEAPAAALLRYVERRDSEEGASHQVAL